MALIISLFWTESDTTTVGKYSPTSFSQIQSMNLTRKRYKKDNIMKLTTVAKVLNSEAHNVANNLNITVVYKNYNIYVPRYTSLTLHSECKLTNPIKLQNYKTIWVLVLIT
jgi:hypothetical protein